MFSFILKSLPITIPFGLFYLQFTGIISGEMFIIGIVGLLYAMYLGMRSVS